MFLLNGNPISIDNEVTIDGIRYPNLRDPALRQQLGVTEAPDPEQYDQRFYWGVGVPKDLDGLKKQWTAQVKETAGKLLLATDWMVVRKVERNVEIPADIVTKRSVVMAECDRLETAISGCADVPALISVVSSQNWGQ